MTLSRGSKLKSLFSVSIAATMIMLEKLEISNCEELKHIIRNEVEDDCHLNCNPIFPNLQSLQILYCNKLEFIFPSTLFGGLQKLKSIEIYGAHELKCVFGKYHEEDCVSNENENNEPHIHLPALETLSLGDVPNMIGIGITKYHVECPSLQTVEAPKESCATSNKGITETFHTTECLMRRPLNLQNIRHMTLSRGSKLKSLFSVSIATTMIMLEKLEISNCEELKYIITNEAEDDCHLNRNPIFPNLQSLQIWDCNKLEFIFPSTLSGGLQKLKSINIYTAHELKCVFGKYYKEDCVSDENENNEPHIHLPALETLSMTDCNKLEFIFPFSLFGSLQKLKSLVIKEAAELKYIFGKNHDGDYLSNENESDKLHIHLPALEELAFIHAPKIINNIHAEKYQLSFPLLKSIELGDLQEFNGKSFPDLMAYLQLSVKPPKDLMKIIKDVQKLTKIGVEDLKIEEVLNLDGVEIEGPIMTLSLEEMWLRNLSELRYICKGSEYILSICNLCKLDIRACKKLRVIFCVSIVKSFPQLISLTIRDCDELADIIEESSEDHSHHQLYFPKLERIDIMRCKRLKCLFFISTPFMLPRLKDLRVVEASELEQVFIRKQDGRENMVVEDVFPMLSYLMLVKLPMLVAICEGIDFQTVKNLKVVDVPKYQGGASILDSKNKAAREEQLSSVNYSNAQVVPYMGETSGSSNLAEISEETLTEAEAKVPTLTLERQASKTSAAKSQLRGASLHSLSSSIVSQVGGSQYDPSRLVASMKETHEQGSQEDDATEEATVTIQSTDTKSKNQTNVSSIIARSSKETEKEAVRIHDASLLSMAPTWTNSKSIKDTMEQGLEESNAKNDVTAVGSTNSNLAKQSTGPIDNLSGKDSALSSKEVLRTSFEEVSSSMSMDETLKEIEAKELTPSLEKQALKVSTDKPQSRTTVLRELVDEHSMCEATLLDQLKDLGETNISIAVPRKSKIPFDDDSIDIIVKERVQESSTSKDVILETLLADLAPRNLSVASITTLQEAFPLDLTKKELRSGTTMTNQQALLEKTFNSIGNIQEHTATVKAKTNASFTYSQVKGSESSPSTMNVESIQEETSTMEDKIDISSLYAHVVEGLQLGPSMGIMEQTLVENQAKDHTPTSKKQTSETSAAKSQLRGTSLHSSEETEKEVVRIHAPRLLTAPTLTNSEIAQSIKDTMEQGLEGSYAENDVMTIVGSTNSDSRKQFVGPINNLSGNDFALSAAKETTKGIDENTTTTNTSRMATPFESKFIRAITVKETRDHLSVEEESKSKKPIKAILPQVIPSLHHQSQIADVGTTSSPNKLGVCEIFQLVELKDGETALLAQALERYPQLLLDQDHHSRRMIAWSYRVLVDILVVLATKTPYSITSSEKSTLEANLCDATLLGVDKEWVDLVRSRVFGADMSDVLVAEEEIQVKEAELETCDIALEQVRKQRVEAKERLAVARRQLEMAQIEFETTHSQLLGLLEERKKLITEITEFREIISAKDRPFGI